MVQRTATSRINQPHSNGVCQEKWFRSERGTFKVQQRKKRNERQNGHERQKQNEHDTDTEYIPIANYGLRIETVLFVLEISGIRVRYGIEFITPDGIRSQTLKHEDLADEQSFLRVAIPGFAITSIPKAFSLLRECLMDDLPQAKREAVLTRFGWYLWQKKPVFAHAGGVISADSDLLAPCPESTTGTVQLLDLTDIDAACSNVPILAGKDRPITAIHVDSPEQLSRYRLTPPRTKDEIQHAVRAVFDLLELGDSRVTYLAVLALFATAIKNPRFAIFLFGMTGSLKTAWALLLLSFFIPDARESDCASFKSTENALCARFGASGNIAVVVDDYVEKPGARNGGDEATKAENVIRPVVNGTAKERCKGDGGLRPNDRPRGLPIITGESLPAGLDSLKQRTINLPVDSSTFEGAVDGPRPNRLDAFQAMATGGVFAAAMAAFIAWAASRLPLLREYMEDPGHCFHAERPVHFRLIDALRDILSGAAMFLDFAKEVGVCSDDEYEQHANLAIEAAENALDRAYLDSLDDRPTEAFGQLLRSALSSLSCHIEVKNVQEHSETDYAIPFELLGYTEHTIREPREGNLPDNAGDDDAERRDGQEVETRTIYKPHGRRVGWIENDQIDLIPEAVLAVVNSMAAKAGTFSLPGAKALGKLLASENWIAAKNKDRNTFKVRCGKVTHDVWRIHALRLFEPAFEWGAFDVECYREMSAAERRHARETHRREVLATVRARLTDFQSNRLLNPFLTEADRAELLTPNSPESEDSSTQPDSPARRYRPIPPQPRSIPGYDDPEGHDLLDA